MARVVHFEVPVDDPARARAFYEQVGGWSFQSWGDQPYWLATTGPDDAPGVHGALTPRSADYRGVVLTLQVEALDAPSVAWKPPLAVFSSNGMLFPGSDGSRSVWTPRGTCSVCWRRIRLRSSAPVRRA
jgi:catechol 2,3-dioxygenase-like lactoylglutathione lyase family enzyme